MPATINPLTLDPCERVFAALAPPHCSLCDSTGMIPPVDDDGQDCPGHWDPCPACTDDLASMLRDEARQWHHDEAAMLAPVMDDGDTDSVPF